MIDQDRFPLAGKRTNVAPAHVVTSPAFDAPAPTVINPEHFEPGVRQLMEQAWNKGRFAAVDLQVFHLKDVYLCGECLILDDQLQVIENASDPYSDDEVQGALGDVARLLKASLLPNHMWGVVSKRRAVGNYGHYLMEMLPMAAVGRRFVHAFDPLYVVHRVQPELQDVVFRTMRLLGIPLDKLLVKDFNEPVFFKNLMIARGLTLHGSYMSPLCVAAVDEMAASVHPGPYRKLFIRRVPGWNRGRALLNQDEVCARLTACGFTVIEPGTMTLEQQIAAFRGADHVVGVSGAAMTNIVFCKPGTQITMVVPGRFPDTFFWFIGVHKQFDFTEIRVFQDGAMGANSWMADFSMSEADIAYIESLSRAAGPAVSAMSYLRGGAAAPPVATTIPPYSTPEDTVPGRRASRWSRLFRGR